MPDNRISIDKDKDKLFIAICKQDVHSFVMFGVYDTDKETNRDKVTHVLCRIGKIADAGSSSEESGYFFTFLEVLKLLFGGATKAKIKDEGVSRSYSGGVPITYQAYDLSYAQYKEFLQGLEGLQTQDNQFEVYKPISEQGSELVLELTSDLILYCARPQSEVLKEGSCELAINNNCRHTAIRLLEQATHAPPASLVSSNFISALPYNTQLEYGKPSENIPFYVLPVSPDAYPELNQEKRDILVKLYSRMEQMLLIAPGALQTQKKFQCLKELYIRMIGPQKDVSLQELLFSIKSWQEQNKSILGELRETYFWDSFFKRESATTQMITEIVEDVQRKYGCD
jgi:hypothetical protein